MIRETMPAVDFIVNRRDLRERRFDDAPPLDEVALSGGEVVLRVDAFALTANNLSYAALGEALRYWEFFPAPEGFGRIPAWGFGTVVRSHHPDVVEGSRYYGFYPMSTHVTVRPGRTSPAMFVDAAPHRAPMHALYNQYTLAADSSADADAIHMLLRPLFITSFVLDDDLDANELYGATRIVISSASSKTAYGTAFLMASRIREAGRGVELVGLTSERNARFVETLGFYDRVISYDDVAALGAGPSAIYLDFAADPALRRAVHERFGESLRRSISLGFTHWESNLATGDEATLPGPAPVTYFAPAAIKRRIGEWGAAGFNQRLDAAWNRFTAAIRDHGTEWLYVTYGSGPSALERVYDDAVAGRLAPSEGHILTLSA